MSEPSKEGAVKSPSNLTELDCPGILQTLLTYRRMEEVITIEETATIKELTGQFQRPVAIARGTIKTHGKAKVARISGMAFANLFYGVTPSAGQLATSFAEAGTVPATTPFTVAVANAATFTDDEGVLYAATGLPLPQVPSAPATGQYSVAVVVYTFNAADAGKAVVTSYTYTASGAGQKFTVANQLLGTTPTFQAVFYTTFQNQAILLKLNN